MEEGIIKGLYPESCMLISEREEKQMIREARIKERLASRAHLGSEDLAVESMTAELQKLQGARA